MVLRELNYKVYHIHNYDILRTYINNFFKKIKLIIKNLWFFCISLINYINKFKNIPDLPSYQSKSSSLSPYSPFYKNNYAYEQHIKNVQLSVLIMELEKSIEEKDVNKMEKIKKNIEKIKSKIKKLNKKITEYNDIIIIKSKLIYNLIMKYRINKIDIKNFMSIETPNSIFDFINDNNKDDIIIFLKSLDYQTLERFHIELIEAEKKMLEIISSLSFKKIYVNLNSNSYEICIKFEDDIILSNEINDIKCNTEDLNNEELQNYKYKINNFMTNYIEVKEFKILYLLEYLFKLKKNPDNLNQIHHIIQIINQTKTNLEDDYLKEQLINFGIEGNLYEYLNKYLNEILRMNGGRKKINK